MSIIKILDCTLRDGGYVNNWGFGYENIKSILSRLAKANLDIIECGFLEDIEYERQCSFFSNIEQIESLLPKDRGTSQFVAMTRYGNLDINNLKFNNGSSIDGIRVTFHEHEADEAIEYCKQIKEKGYKVYVQPVGTTSYTDLRLLKIIEVVNTIKPYAFYMVDTLGIMKKNDILRMFHLIDNNLTKDIAIGFHSHNNLQLSFSNAQELIDIHSKRDIIIDSSVYGMGRGAGNLNSELIAEYLNSIKNKNYDIDFLLEIVDDLIKDIKEKYSWGYSVPYYLAATNNCHPNYAAYLMNKKTLPVKSIGEILRSIEGSKKELYDKQYISKLYTEYQEHNIDDGYDIEKLKKLFNERKLLILAPGSSLKKESFKIQEYVKKNKPIIISVNFKGNGIKPNIIFFSNSKRFQKFNDSGVNENIKTDIIITSNISTNIGKYTYRVNYSDLTNNQNSVSDNATLMLIALLIKSEIKDVQIAGFDGFETSTNKHYANKNLETELDKEVLLEMNESITNIVKEYSEKININFITHSLYESDKESENKSIKQIAASLI